MMPPAYVKAYVKRNKTDAADAEAICEAVTRPTMRFVPIKAPVEQAAGMVLKTRELFIRQRSQTANAMRAHMAELGIIAATGMTSIAKLVLILRDKEDTRVPVAARAALLAMAEQIEMLTARIETLDTSIAPTMITTNGPCSPSKWQTRRSLRANRRGTCATAAGPTLKSRPGTWTVRSSRPFQGMCTRW